MDFQIPAILWPLFAVGLVLGLIVGQYRNRYTAVAAVAAAVLTYFVGLPLDSLVFGFAAGFLIIALRNNLAALLVTSGVAAIMFFYGFPLLNSWRSVEGIHTEAIHAESLEYADAATTTLTKQNRPVVDAAKAGELNLAMQGEALRNRGQVGYQQVTNERRAMLELKGVTFGQFAVPANIIARPIQDTASLNTATLFDTQKEVCGKATLVMHGQVNSDETNRTLTRWVDGRGWVDSNGSPLPDPAEWRSHHKVFEDAPYMAALVYLGDNSVPRYDWEPTKRDANGTVTAVSMTVVVNGCQAIRWAFNDYFADNSRIPMFQPEFQARNVGSYPVSLSTDYRKGGVQIELIQ